MSLWSRYFFYHFETWMWHTLVSWASPDFIFSQCLKKFVAILLPCLNVNVKYLNRSVRYVDLFAAVKSLWKRKAIHTEHKQGRRGRGERWRRGTKTRITSWIHGSTDPRTGINAGFKFHKIKIHKCLTWSLLSWLWIHKSGISIF